MTTATFVVRFWREQTEEDECWRGRIEHVQSGESAAFRDLECLLRFLQRFGIRAQDSVQLTHNEI